MKPASQAILLKKNLTDDSALIRHTEVLSLALL